MEINIFIEKYFWEQKKILSTGTPKKLDKFIFFKYKPVFLKKIKNLNRDIKEEYYNVNIEKLPAENKEDLSIITDGFCS